MSLGHRLHARCACSSAGAPFVLAGTERKYERARPFAIPHLFLDLVLDVKQKAVSGTAILDFERVAPDAEEIRLDAIGFELERVRLDLGRGWEDAKYEYDGDAILIRKLAAVPHGRIEVTYRATPRRGIYFLGPDEKVKDRPVQVWTQCQDEDARHWFPCHDKPHVKMTTELRVQVPSGFTVLSNGDQLSAEKPSGKRPWTYHFRLDRPHPSYLVTLVAGEFEVLEDRDASLDSGNIPVRYYVPKQRVEDGRRAFAETPRMIELFSRVTGVPFPWKQYSQIVVSDFIFGGMENTTATTMYEHILLDERAAIDISSHDLVAHELAHQWFGDFVTCRDWSHGWLNEGFATYFEHVEREDRLGRDEYDYGVANDLESYLAEANGRYSRPIVCRDYAEPIDLFDRHLYEKGALVLHMLRRDLGDDLFWRGVRAYLERHRYAIVETNDLQRALEQVSGRSLEQFFDQWVYRPGHPDLRVKVAFEDGLLSVTVKQAQKTGDTAVFALEFEIEVMKKDGGVERRRKTLTTAHDALVMPLDERPQYVAIDPDMRITCALSVDAPADMLRNQLRQGSRAIVRSSAALALAKRDDPPTITALGETLSNEKEAWMVRAEAARSLSKIRSEQCFAWLEKQAETAHPKVRRAVALALGSFRTSDSATLLSKLAKRDKSYLVSGDAARALGRTRQPAAIKALLEVIDKASWADVVRAGALDGLAALRDEEAVSPVLERTRYGIPTRGRRAAIAALAQLSDARRVREHLEDLLDDKDPYLRIEVVSALQSLGDTKSRGPLRRALTRELDGRVARRIREALRDMGETSATDRRRVNDELENVRNELSELKARLSKLEASKKKHAETKAPEVETKSSSAKKAHAARKPKPARAHAKPKSKPARGKKR